MTDALTDAPALRITPGAREERTDALAVEEPLELRLHGVGLHGDGGSLTLGVLMRTPGHDRELLTGWLISEGLLPAGLGQGGATLEADAENANVWHLHTPEFARLSLGARLSVSSSACGVCGSGSIERLAVRAGGPVWGGGLLQPALLSRLPDALLKAQTGFRASGGLHAAGLFTARGELRAAYEDVGRHNAVDKAVGWAHAAGADPRGLILCVSSRAGFEIVQKAVTAGLAVVVTVGAATSLAVDTALTFGVTLCAFVREGRLTVYSGAERLEN